jgi:hypothetical protein
MNERIQDSPPLERFQQPALRVGLIGLALCALAALLSPGQLFRAYLEGYLFWSGIAVGSLALLMLYHLVGGRWGYLIRRPLEAATRTLPLLALLFLPLLFGLHDLYPWSRPEAQADQLLRHKSAYLNVPFFVLRAALYFVAWILLARRLNRLSAEQDRIEDVTLSLKLRRTSGPGLLLYALTVTCAGWDWVMSLEPKWWSTIFGMANMVGQGLSALALMVVVAHLLARREPYSEEATPANFHDLGNLLLMFVILWAYLAFSQFLIIWAGNLTEEIVWYLPRYRTSWVWIGGALLVLYFFLPFILLLLRRTKRSRHALAKVAAGLLVLRLLDLIWTVEPTFEPHGLKLHWLDLAAPVGIGGIWLFGYLRELQQRPLLVLHDSRVKEAAEHG